MTTTSATNNEQSKLLSYQDIHIKHINVDYEDYDEDIVKKQRRSITSFCRKMPLILVPMAIVAGVYTYDWLTEVPAHHHDHTIPTLLSVRQAANGNVFNQGGSGFVNAADNALYDLMKIAEYNTDFKNDKNDDDEVTTVKIIDTDKDIISFHDNITITWELEVNGDQPRLNIDDDVIALYCPADENDPTKFRDAATIAQIRSTNFYNVNIKAFDRNRMLRRTQESTTATTTHQWYIPSFPIVREDTCEVRYWVRKRDEYHQDCWGKDVLRFQLGGKSKFQIDHGLTQPTTIHLALTSKPTQMLVHFSTGAEGKPIVIYHQDAGVVNSGNLTSGLNVQQGKSTTYHANDMCQAPANIEEPGKFTSPGMLHSVTMSNLEQNSTYYYKVGILSNYDEDIDKSLDKIVWSDTYSFSSPLPTKSLDGRQNLFQPFSFLVYADQGAMGYGNDDGAVRVEAWANKEISMNQIRAVHHIGDLSYAQGASIMWDKWLDMVSVISTRVPLMVGIGNHEYDHTDGGQDGKDPSGLKTPGGFMPRWGDFGTDSNGECGVPVARRFTMPDNGNGVFWYSYNMSNVHIIMLSSEHDLSPDSEQYKWLEADLSSVNRTLTPWVIIETHRSMYNIEDIPANTAVGIGMRKEFEGLLKEYSVDLYLSGHYHSYMRSCSGLFQSKCDNGGPIHITVGTAGAELDNVPLLREKWMEAYIVQWGYGRITSLSDNELLWEFVVESDGLSNGVLDSVRIIK